MDNDPGTDATSTAGVSRSRWGRTTVGTKNVSALLVAIPIGVVVAVVVATVVVATGTVGTPAVVGGLATAFAFGWAAAGLAWVLTVDRNTLDGAPRDPERSIESVWHDRAASGAFRDVLLVAGTATTVVALTGFEMPTAVALASVVALAMGSFGLRYVVLQRRG